MMSQFADVNQCQDSQMSISHCGVSEWQDSDQKQSAAHLMYMTHLPNRAPKSYVGYSCFQEDPLLKCL